MLTPKIRAFIEDGTVGMLSTVMPNGLLQTQPV
jgi:hypothetical protein